MSLLSPSRTFYSEKARYNPGISTAGRYRINIQIGSEQFHVVIQLQESRTFNYIMDELQPVFDLTEFQRANTRIYLQTILGETEILVNSRPNYGTERNIDYIGIPANPERLPSAQRNGGIWLCFTIIMLFVAAALVAFIGVEFFILRPRLIASTKLKLSSEGMPPLASAAPITASMVTPLPVVDPVPSAVPVANASPVTTGSKNASVSTGPTVLLSSMTHKQRKRMATSLLSAVGDLRRTW